MEKVSALFEEQSLTKDELMGYLRQVMEIRALENNIANLLKSDSIGNCQISTISLRLAVDFPRYTGRSLFNRDILVQPLWA